METRTGQLSGSLRASGAYLLTGSLAGVNAAIPGASAYVSGCSIPVLFAFATGGAGAVPAPTAGQTAAIVYLAVAVCAGGFYLLYSALPRLGADRAGLFAGLVPFGAMGAELLLGAGTIGAADVAGAVLVAAGVAAGAGAGRAGGGVAGRRAGQQQEEDTAAAPQQSRTRTGAPRA